MSLTIRGLLVITLLLGALAFALAPAACSESEEQSSSTSGSGGEGGLGGGDVGGASNGGGGGGGGTPLPESGAVFFADQDLVIPEVAAAGDTVGHAKTSPTVILADPTFEIIAGDNAAQFVMEAGTGLLTVADGASFDAATEATIPLTVRVGEPALGSNTAVVTVHVLAAATTVFIDPDNSADTAQDGSIDHPYDSFTDVSITSGYAYLLKRETQTYVDGALEIGVNDILIGAYGSGGRPYFESSSSSHAIYNWTGPQNVIVRDLEIRSTGDSCVRFGGATGANERIDNVVCHGPGWGVRAFSVAGLTIVNSEIYDIRDDGIFTAENTKVEIAFNDIHDVNQNWVEPYTPQTQAGGDAIQFVDNNQWHVHHNRLDRTNSGNKFCFIATNPSYPNLTVDEGVFEHNLLLGPKTTGDGGASIYFGSDAANLIVRYNTILAPSPGAIWSHSENLVFHGNVVSGIAALTCLASSPCTVDHNVFHAIDHDRILFSDCGLVARNNIFDTDQDTVAISNTGSLVESNNLYVQGPTGGDDGIEGDPLFVDPASGDFRLQAASPAIDSGLDAGYTVDMDGHPIPTGAAPDIGAYEYVE